MCWEYYNLCQEQRWKKIYSETLITNTGTKCEGTGPWSISSAEARPARLDHVWGHNSCVITNHKLWVLTRRWDADQMTTHRPAPPAPVRLGPGSRVSGAARAFNWESAQAVISQSIPHWRRDGEIKIAFVFISDSQMKLLSLPQNVWSFKLTITAG